MLDVVRRLSALAMAAALGSCAGAGQGAGDYVQGPLQPQAVSGPCQVKKFYLLAFTTVRAEMTVGNTGQACTMTLLNPDLQIVLTAALVTTPAGHGRAAAGLTTGNRQGVVSYAPQPGYAGSDRFAVTFEPNAIGITYDVTVQP